MLRSMEELETAINKMKLGKSEVANNMTTDMIRFNGEKNNFYI